MIHVNRASSSRAALPRGASSVAARSAVKAWTWSMRWWMTAGTVLMLSRAIASRACSVSGFRTDAALRIACVGTAA